MRFSPALFEHGVGEEEGHVDPHGGAEGGHHDVALTFRNLGGPKSGIFSRRGDGLEEGRGRPGEEPEVGDKAGKDRFKIEVPGKSEGPDHPEEGDHDHPDHRLEDDFEAFHALVSALVEVIDDQSGEEEDHTDDTGGGEAGRFSPEQILLHRGGSEGKLRHAPDDVGHERGNDPGPGEDRADVRFDRAEGTLAG